jgi:hypothetical protein
VNEEAEGRAAEEAERRMCEQMRKMVRAEEERQRRYGKVRPVISAMFQAHRFVAVGVREITEEKGKSPFEVIVFTNRPHLYGEAGEPDPPSHGYQKQPATSPVPEAIANALGDAAAQYGNVPTDFPWRF